MNATPILRPSLWTLWLLLATAGYAWAQPDVRQAPAQDGTTAGPVDSRRNPEASPPANATNTPGAAAQTDPSQASVTPEIAATPLPGASNSPTPDPSTELQPQEGAHHLAVSPAKGAESAIPPLAQDSTPPPASAPARTYQHRFGLQIDLGFLHLSDRSYDLFDDRDMALSLGLSAEADLLKVSGSGTLSVQAGWLHEGEQDAVLASNLQSELNADYYSLAGRIRVQLWPWLMPHARLALGATDMGVHFTMASGGEDRHFASNSWLPFAALGLGTSVLTPPTQRVVGFFQLEGGYLLSAGMPLKLEPDQPKDSLPASGARLGELDRSGIYLRFGAGARL